MEWMEGLIVEPGEVEVAGTGSGRSCSRIAGEACKSSRSSSRWYGRGEMEVLWGEVRVQFVKAKDDEE